MGKLKVLRPQARMIRDLSKEQNLRSGWISTAFGYVLNLKVWGEKKMIRSIFHLLEGYFRQQTGSEWGEL